MSSSTTRESDPGQRAHDRPVLLHSLVFLDEGAEVTVGRADVDGFLDDLDELGFLRDPGEAAQLSRCAGSGSRAAWFFSPAGAGCPGRWR